MKNLILFLAIAATLFTSCEKESRSFPVGTWHTTNQYYDLTIHALPFEMERIKELTGRENMEISVDVSEAERFEVTFNDNGTGSGSGLRFEEEGRHRFSFMWKFSEGDIIFYDGNSSLGNEYIDHFHWRSLGDNNWKIEEYSADKMMLVRSNEVFFDRFQDDPVWGWSEEHTYRYTFERVK